GVKLPTPLLDRSESGWGIATVLGAVKGRALTRPPQAVSSLDRSCAPWPLQPVGTKGVPTPTPPPAGRTKGCYEGVPAWFFGGRPRRRGGLETAFGRMASGTRSACWRRR